MPRSRSSKNVIPRVFTLKRERGRSKVSFFSSAGSVWAESLFLDFTGISAPYEAPEKPEIHVETDKVDVAGAVAQIVKYLEEQGLIPAESSA